VCMHVCEKGREERERDDTVELMVIAPKVILQLVEENRPVCLYCLFHKSNCQIYKISKIL
jgi:hypothetical protein